RGAEHGGTERADDRRWRNAKRPDDDVHPRNFRNSGHSGIFICGFDDPVVVFAGASLAGIPSRREKTTLAAAALLLLAVHDHRRGRESRVVAHGQRDMTDLIARFRGRRDEVLAHCPNDDWDFRPRYTEGCCPICGWRAEDVGFSEPLMARLDWFWPAMGFLALVSIVMAIAVIVTYVRA